MLAQNNRILKYWPMMKNPKFIELAFDSYDPQKIAISLHKNLSKVVEFLWPFLDWFIEVSILLFSMQIFK